MRDALKKALAGIAALAALGLGGAAIAGATGGGQSNSGTDQSEPAQADEAAEGQEAENSAADRDSVQDENGKDDASEGPESTNEEADAMVNGQDAERAKRAALAETGGGTATAVERDNERGATYEVEVTKTDGSTVDVRLDSAFKVTAVDQDTESGADEQDD